MGTDDTLTVFSKGHLANWNYKLCQVTEINCDTNPIYFLEKLSEHFNEAKSKKSVFISKQNGRNMEKLFFHFQNLKGYANEETHQ